MAKQLYIHFELEIQKINCFIAYGGLVTLQHSTFETILLFSADFLDTAITSLVKFSLHYLNEILVSLLTVAKLRSCLVLCRVSLSLFVFSFFSVHHYPCDWGVVKLAFAVQNFRFFTVFDSHRLIGLPG